MKRRSALRAKLLVLALLLAAGAIAFPGATADGQVGPCWQCRLITVPVPGDPFTWALCWDFGDDRGRENCLEVLQGGACLFWGNTCQKGI